MTQGLIAYRSWDVRRFTDWPREVAAANAEELAALAREIDSPVTWQVAAQHLAREDDPDPRALPLYWKIIERMHGRFAEARLPNAPFYPCPIDQLVRVDAELARQSVPLSLTELVLGEPRYEDIPTAESPLVSWWSPDQIEQARAPLLAMTPPNDPWLAEAIATIRGWFAVVAATKSHLNSTSRACIVGFYY